MRGFGEIAVEESVVYIRTDEIVRVCFGMQDGLKRVGGEENRSGLLDFVRAANEFHQRRDAAK